MESKYVSVSLYCGYYIVQGVCDNCAGPEVPNNRKGVGKWNKILCAIALIYFQVEGVGPNGRMFLFKKPSLEDQNATLWNMYYSMKREKDSLREKLNYEVSISTLSL